MPNTSSLPCAPKFALLDCIESPEQLRNLDVARLPELADELRQFVLQSVAKTGGHLSSNLGTIELTVALHFVFNTPIDRLVWDVGHQTYPHKILTGRKPRMHTLRQLHGLSGFPLRTESEFDAFGVGHSSTSISAALGMALAGKIKGGADAQRRVVAIIGDGAMTAGMAFEALNNAGVAECNVLVILNDNDMSISPPVGALNRYLAQLMGGQFYTKAKQAGRQVLKVAPPLLELARRIEGRAKDMVIPTTLFEKFGFTYTGPVDGHDLSVLVPVLQHLKNQTGPQFLHVVTKKGQGYSFAENDPIAYHGPSPFDPLVGIVKAQSTLPPTAVTTKAESGNTPKITFTQVFGQWLCDMAAIDKRLVGITPAMREGSGMVAFERQFPERYFDVGIAEQHAVTFAAGLACEGLKPVVAIYSTFLQRAYDQLIHDVALQNLPVVFAIDRAGLVGADGATHAGAYDVAFLRCIPNMGIACPANEQECRQLLSTAFAQMQPIAVRYPRGQGAGIVPHLDLNPLPFGVGEVVRMRQKNTPSAPPLYAIAILVWGSLLHVALQNEVAEIFDATVVNMRWVKPMDEVLLLQIASSHGLLVTLEDSCKMGGAGSAVLECLQKNHIQTPVLQLGLSDAFIEHGDVQQLMASQGLDAIGIAKAIKNRLTFLNPVCLV